MEDPTNAAAAGRHKSCMTDPAFSFKIQGQGGVQPNERGWSDCFVTVYQDIRYHFDIRHRVHTTRVTNTENILPFEHLRPD